MKKSMKKLVKMTVRQIEKVEKRKGGNGSGAPRGFTLDSGGGCGSSGLKKSSKLLVLILD